MSDSQRYLKHISYSYIYLFLFKIWLDLRFFYRKNREKGNTFESNKWRKSFTLFIRCWVKRLAEFCDYCFKNHACKTRPFNALNNFKDLRRPSSRIFTVKFRWTPAVDNYKIDRFIAYVLNICKLYFHGRSSLSKLFFHVVFLK